MTLREILDRLVCTLYPARCVLCGEVVEYDDLTCAACASSDFTPLKLEAGDALGGLACALPYAGGTKDAVLLLKRQPDRRAAAYFASRMAELAREQWGGLPQVVAPVPISPARLRERGFNQALLLAEQTARLLELPVCAHTLLRHDGEAQHTLSAHERAENARRSYALADGSGAVEGKQVLLVDDVFTTGATMRACAGLLRRAGAQTVYGVAAAYTVSENA